MAAAIRKLAQLDAETRALPGRDCGVSAHPPAPRSQKTSSWSAPHGRSARTSPWRRRARHEARGHRPGRTRVRPNSRRRSPATATPRSTAATRRTCSVTCSRTRPRAACWSPCRYTSNVIAVASHAEFAAVVVFAGGRKPEDDVLAKAAAEGLSLYSAPADTFDIVGRLRSRREREPCVNVCFADLHVHTALSPCADAGMTPPANSRRRSLRAWP